MRTFRQRLSGDWKLMPRGRRDRIRSSLCGREGRPMRRILVVANQTATNQHLLDAIKGRAAKEKCAFTLVMPAVPAKSSTMTGMLSASVNIPQSSGGDEGKEYRVAQHRLDSAIESCDRRSDQGDRGLSQVPGVRRDHRVDIAARYFTLAASGSSPPDRAKVSPSSSGDNSPALKRLFEYTLGRSGAASRAGCDWPFGRSTMK
jgi:hypothetical protein